MKIFTSVIFLFFLGAVIGWAIEVVFRRFFSHSNPEHKWINPGCCTGPYLPLYGFGLCILYLFSSLDRFTLTGNPVWNKILIMLLIALSMTAIEYIAGIISLKFYHVRLWDYSMLWGNIQGIICPLFSLFWAMLGAVYYFALHAYFERMVAWLAVHTEFLFVLGAVTGIFVVDLCHSLRLLQKLKKFSEEYQVVMRYESIKENIRAYCEKTSRKYRFFRPFESERPLREHLREMAESFEGRVTKIVARKKG